MATTPGNSLNISQAGVVSFNGTATFTGSPLTQHDVLVGGTSNAITSITPSTAGFVLTSNGVSVDPSFQSVSASGALTTLTGDSGGAVSPTAGNINILGGTTGLTFSGSASTLTLNSPELNLPDTTSSTVGVINVNGNRFMHKYGDADNVFVGTNAGNFTNTTALANTALGSGALTALTTGDNNVAVGKGALASLTTSIGVTAIGRNAMTLAQLNCSSTIAIGNAAFSSFVSGAGGNSVFIGNSCALNWTASSQCTLIGAGSGGGGVGGSTNSTGLGFGCLSTLTSGNQNSTCGAAGLALISTGANNSSLGFNAGGTLTTSDSNNIMINNTGTAGDNNVCRIGASTGTGAFQLNATFIHGVFGKTVGVSGLPVVVDNVGQFGTVVSSRRYKENIEDLNDLSSRVLSLRPVIFNYKDKDYKSYGLIAEEVNEIMPELVVKNLDDEIEGVKYQDLPILLLNELKKALKRIEELERRLA